MSHLFSLGCPWPICFPWASLALFLTLHSHGLLLSSLGFPSPIALSLTFRAHGLSINPSLSLLSLIWACRGPFSLFHIIYCLWFAFLSFRALLSPFTPSRPICLSHGPVIHYSCRLGLLVFLSIYQLFPIYVVGLLLSTWASKMAINKEFLGEVSYIRRFILGLASITSAFTRLLKKGQSFEWEETQQTAFKRLQQIIMNLPTVQASIWKKPLMLYLATNSYAIGALIAYEDEGGIEQPVYYISRALKDTETHYPRAERTCLAIVYASQRLRHYFLAYEM